MPGNDDANWYVRINNFLKDSEGAAIIPLILINLTQGTFDLTHNQELKQIFCSKDNEKMILVIFTRFQNAYD